MGTSKCIEQQSDNRSRNWATIVYEESAPNDWIDILSNQHVKAFISPLHNADKNDDGTPKKPHYHILYMFDGKKSSSQMREMFEKIGGVGCEKVQSLKAYARYLCHLDEGGTKPFYDVDDVLSFGGADYKTTARSDIDRIVQLTDIFKFIKSTELYSFDDLIDAFIDNDMSDYLDIVLKNTHVITPYMNAKSRKYWAKIEAMRDIRREEKEDLHAELMLKLLKGKKG